MILSMASDLTTRRIVWAGRMTDDAPQTCGIDLPLTVESEWLAGAYAEKYAHEATHARDLCCF